MVQKKNMDSLNELKFANLPKNQEERLRELERQFNYEFGEDFYFMVMNRTEQSEDNKDRLP